MIPASKYSFCELSIVGIVKKSIVVYIFLRKFTVDSPGDTSGLAPSLIRSSTSNEVLLLVVPLTGADSTVLSDEPNFS